MKYSELHETIENLRALADWLESNPKAVKLPAIALTANEYIYAYAKKADGSTDYSQTDEYETRSKMREIARALGSCEKDYSGGLFELTKQFGDNYGSRIRLIFRTKRDAVCRKVVKSTKTIPAETRVIPERIEEEVEWVCTDSLLASN